ncbi:MAG: hypothetical protein ACLFO1_00615 [Spirochaetaceae bacterium]
MKRIVTLALLIALTAGFAAAQSNELIDELLATEEAPFAAAVYLVMLAGGEISEDTSVQEAYNQFDFSNRRIKERAPDAPVTLGEVAYLSMETLGISGGIMYSLVPSPRYAAREFKYLRLVPGKGYPGRVLSGREVVDLIGRATRYADRQGS